LLQFIFILAGKVAVTEHSYIDHPTSIIINGPGNFMGELAMRFRSRSKQSADGDRRNEVDGGGRSLENRRGRNDCQT
jgi:hypothetical protein